MADWLIDNNQVTTVRSSLGERVASSSKVDNKVDRFEQGAKEALTGLSERLEGVEEDLKLLRNEVKGVQSQFTSFPQETNARFDNPRGQCAELRSSLSNTTAIQLNALRKLSDDPIEPVSALITVQGKLVSAIAPDFPQTVREFWQLTSNMSALLRLAEHYSVTGWERWQRNNSDETDRTEFAELDIAVAANLVRSYGARHVFDYKDEEVVSKINAAVPNVSHTFNTIGNSTSSSSASQTLRDGKGRLYTASKEDHELASELFEKLPDWLGQGTVKPGHPKVLRGLDAVSEGFQGYRDGKISAYKIDCL
ncbi:hypothetical protein BJX63DRAFT_438749 [Aspergillus granulosus]|uniref:Uncharacterized protein n=1 Tax=Aspergillus granulosus TaxID=176169 RepID=A0ABR4GR25_9EURO